MQKNTNNDDIVHMRRYRNFFQARLPENSSDKFFLVFNLFTVLQWIINGLFQRKLSVYFSKVSGLVQHFPGGPTFSRGGGGGGVQLFPGGV